MQRFAVVLLLLAAGLSGQKKQKDMPAGGPANSRLVTLNVSAVDASGSRPDDLSQDDFQIFDNGKPQRIVSFRKNNLKAQSAAQLGPHEFSNRTGAAIPHATLILFDLMNDRLAAKGYAWSEIIRTLESLENTEYLYLYVLSSDGRFISVHALPDEEGAGRSDHAGDAEWTHDVKARLDAAMVKATRVRPIEMTDVNLRVIATYNALGAIASRLAAIPGRKNLVWITRGVPITLSPIRSGLAEGIDYSGPLRGLTAALEHSNIAVYPVDIAPPGTEAILASDASRGAATPAAVTEPLQGVGSADTLQQFADLTGGQAYLNNNVKAAIQQAIGDARMSYTLTYYPAPYVADSKYHKIKLICARKGVKVHSQVGYYAYNDQLLTRTQQEQTLDAAIASQYDSSSIGIHAVMSRSKKFYSSVHLDFKIEPESGADPEGGQFLITLVDLHDDGKNGISPTVGLDYKPGAGAIPFEQERTLNGTVPKIRIIVMDAKTNALGSLTIPIKPEDLSPPGAAK